MPIIAIATTKGGPGKTTLAMSLARYWARSGLNVECLDTDPNRNLTTWLATAGCPVPCTAIAEDDVVDAAAAADERADVVVIDVAGALAKALVYAVSVAGAVVIPVRPDAKDVAEAARTQQHIETARKMVRRAIPYAATLVQVNRRAQVTAHSRAQLQALGVPVLNADVPLRTAYQQASYTGDPLADASVLDDISAIAAEVMALVESNHGA
ncbi:AAA family ATPase [Azospirillum brasilense]|nr:AAA family ATPase [Azospirillum brasilense]